MRIGVLGLGSIGSRHAGILRGLGHEVHGYDPAKPGHPNMTREDVIEWADAMVIATPTRCHSADLFDCMKANVPTFIEKPLLATREEHDALISPIFHAPFLLFVGYNLRFHRCVVFAKELLDACVIGDVLSASFVCGQFSDKPDYLRDGLILNWSHEIDLPRHLLGGCALKSAWMPEPECADLVLDHGYTLSSVHLNYISNPQVRGFQIVGSKGHITVDLVAARLEYSSPAAEREVHWFYRDSMDRSYVAEMEAFIDFAEGKPHRGATDEDGLAVLGICLHAMEEAG